VLIVNNKGQSVVSHARTRLSAQTRELLHQKEAKQIESATGQYEWRNYRATHSDKRKYTELDPRHGIDADNNFEEDIIARELSNYHALQKMLQNSCREASW
jgi:hypothetical protein